MNWLKLRFKKAKNNGLNGEAAFWPGWFFILICFQLVSGDISCSTSQHSGASTLFSREQHPGGYWFVIMFNLTILVFLVRRIIRKYF